MYRGRRPVYVIHAPDHALTRHPVMILTVCTLRESPMLTLTVRRINLLENHIEKSCIQVISRASLT